ncbi:MAG: molybdopterin molybdotransferase MoeA [Microbacteriaceae bacterium]|nr:molybdopterin molybdotransferase MoeA [Microbacteriaceae bacterium]
MAHSGSEQQFVTVEEYRSRVLELIAPLPPVTTALSNCLGRTLAEAVIAKVDVPGFDNSAMDGYAIRLSDALGASESTPIELEVTGDIAAGSALNLELLPGCAIRIMTGAPIPSGADCVVPVEDTDRDFERGALCGSMRIQVLREPKPDAHIRPAGADIRLGAQVLSKGIALTARDLSAAAATGNAQLPVIPAPRVGIISTGTELQRPGEPLGSGQIYDSNSMLLAGLVIEAGAIAVPLESTTDDPAQLYRQLEVQAPKLDLIVTSGGVSVGAYDVVKEVLTPLGFWFGKVKMQPGKPQGCGTLEDGTPLIALPGNPVSVFVSFEAFVRPAIQKLSGRLELMRPTITAVAKQAWRSPAGKIQFMPVQIINESSIDELNRCEPFVIPATSGGSGSHLVASLAKADGLAIIPESVEEVREGDQVEIIDVR